MEAASEKKDKAAAAKIDGLMKQLGPDFESAWTAGNDLDEKSADGKAYVAASMCWSRSAHRGEPKSHRRPATLAPADKQESCPLLRGSLISLPADVGSSQIVASLQLQARVVSPQNRPHPTTCSHASRHDLCAHGLDDLAATAASAAPLPQTLW